MSDKLLREDKTGKIDYSYLVELKPIIDAFCQRLTEGEIKYARLNWRNCEDPLTYQQSALRHLFQYLNGERDEAHGVAAIVNIAILLDLDNRTFEHTDPNDLANMGCTCNDCRLESANKEKGNETR